MIKIFKRSARNFEEFANARKETVEYVDTEDDAIEKCRDFNSNRTPEEIAKGTKLEWTREE